MSRLIDADALEKKVFERMKQHFSLYERYNICYCNEMTGEIKGQYIEARAVHDLIKKEKTIDAVPAKHGHWIDMGDFEQCSACKWTHLKEFNSFYGRVTRISRMAYCPNCGAKMDLLDDDTKWESTENGVKVTKYNCMKEEIEEVKAIIGEKVTK